jgi:transcriptional regulator with XRE-family HTH domain
LSHAPAPITRKRTFDAELAAAIGFRVRARRESLGFTLRDVEARCELTNATISHYECGRITPTAAAIITLCRALGMSPDELLGWGELP